MRRAIAAIVFLVGCAGSVHAKSLEFTPAQMRFMEFSRIAMEVGASFGPDRLIDKIELIDKDTYRVSSGICTITATLHDVKSDGSFSLFNFFSKNLKIRNYVIKAEPISCASGT
jgi:hypothetical protein